MHLKNHSKIDVVICPELFLSGYGNQEKIYQYSESYDGDYATEISSLAKKYDTSILNFNVLPGKNINEQVSVKKYILKKNY